MMLVYYDTFASGRGTIDISSVAFHWFPHRFNAEHQHVHSLPSLFFYALYVTIVTGVKIF